MERIGSPLSAPSPSWNVARPAPLGPEAAFTERLRRPAPGPGATSTGPLREPRAPPAVDLALQARAALTEVLRDGQRLDGYLRAAQGGAPLGVADLVGMQTLAYRYSQRVDLLTKLVERLTSGLKTALQIQV